MPQDKFLEVAQSLCDNSGRERTSAICYSVGWTQHTVGVQYIRTAAIIQLLLGNIGRPGGGIMALRGHASIQGSTDIPTLYNILPGYLPMPHADAHPDRAAYLEQSTPSTGYWGHADAYLTSLLKAWWGDAATEHNDFCFDHLPRLDGRSLHLPDDAGDEGRRGEGLLPARGESRGRLGERKAAPARDGGAGLARGTGPPGDRERLLLVRRARDYEWRAADRGDRRPRSSFFRPPRTPRRRAASPTRSGCSSGTSRRSRRRLTAAPNCGS